MTEKRSIVLWDRWRHASEKYDYFIAGLSAALTAFVAQRLETVPVNGLAAYFAIGSVFCLAASVALALDRLRSDIAALGANQQALHHQEIRGNIANLLVQGGGQQLIDESGQVFTRDTAAQKVSKHDQAIAKLQPAMDSFEKRSVRSYRYRDRLLVLGVVLYAASRAAAIVAP